MDPRLRYGAGAVLPQPALWPGSAIWPWLLPLLVSLAACSAGVGGRSRPAPFPEAAVPLPAGVTPTALGSSPPAGQRRRPALILRAAEAAGRLDCAADQGLVTPRAALLPAGDSAWTVWAPAHFGWSHRPSGTDLQVTATTNPLVGLYRAAGATEQPEPVAWWTGTPVTFSVKLEASRGQHHVASVLAGFLTSPAVLYAVGAVGAGLDFWPTGRDGLRLSAGFLLLTEPWARGDDGLPEPLRGRAIWLGLDADLHRTVMLVLEGGVNDRIGAEWAGPGHLVAAGLRLRLTRKMSLGASALCVPRADGCLPWLTMSGRR